MPPPPKPSRGLLDYIEPAAQALFGNGPVLGLLGIEPTGPSALELIRSGDPRAAAELALGFAGTTTLGSLDDISKAWAARGVSNAVSKNSTGFINLDKVVVPKAQRGQGVGSAFMRELVQHADETGSPIALTPSADFGGTVSRLKEFYKRFGFVENRGRNKDFTTRHTMIRPPKAAK
jgi:GNAT superfamily N-acetyltransferase